MSESSDDTGRPKREFLPSEAETAMLLPDANVFSFGTPAPRPPLRSESTDLVPVPRRARNVIFSTLVGEDADIAGFVAYGLYKQNKRDWYIAFEEEHRRPPTEPEIRSYILGEGTERRISTYRTLAAQLMQARGIEGRTRLAAVTMPKGEPGNIGVALRPAARPEPRGGSRAMMAPARRKSAFAVLTYLALMVLVVVGIAWVARNGAIYLGLMPGK